MKEVIMIIMIVTMVSTWEYFLMRVRFRSKKICNILNFIIAILVTDSLGKIKGKAQYISYTIIIVGSVVFILLNLYMEAYIKKMITGDGYTLKNNKYLGN